MDSSLLLPQLADAKLFDGDGGSYYSWSTSLLSQEKLGAGRLALQPRGFTLPHYADSAKIGYVLQGTCTVGMVLPNTSEEKVLIINKGDAIPVSMGAVSWWFNGEDSDDVVIIFLGETSKAYIPGQFTYFFLTGTLGILGGFSTEFISQLYNMSEEESKKLVKTQTGVLIIKLKEGTKMPQPCKNTSENMIFNLDNALPDIDVKNGGSLTAITAKNLRLLEEVELSAKRVKLDPNAMLAPMYTTDSSVQVFYVLQGSGRIQIMGLKGECVLDTNVQKGHLFVVPKFFVAATVASGEGIEYFSITTSSKPVFEQLAGNTSVWEALSPEILQTTLGVTAEFEELFKSKVKMSNIVIPHHV